MHWSRLSMIGDPFIAAGSCTTATAAAEPSVGSVGDSYDNALAETINGLYKAELIHRRARWCAFR
jgi:transposase InsO family protein